MNCKLMFGGWQQQKGERTIGVGERRRSNNLGTLFGLLVSWIGGWTKKAKAKKGVSCVVCRPPPFKAKAKATK
jgi:hypothetical protein